MNDARTLLTRVKVNSLIWEREESTTPTAKTRESVAKSRKTVNEKNARLAWRNADTCPLQSMQMEG